MCTCIVLVLSANSNRLGLLVCVCVCVCKQRANLPASTLKSKSAVVVFARELVELGRTSSPKVIKVYLLRC